MKKYLIIFLVLGFFISSCDKDIDKFDNSTNYIYFDIPNKVDNYNRPLANDAREDSLVYSFALDGAEVQSIELEVVVSVMGEPSAIDRPYDIFILEDSTDIDGSNWNSSVISGRIIKAGFLSDTIKVAIKRTEDMLLEWKHILLKIRPNEYFEMGDNRLHSVGISVADIMIEPKWWPDWQYYFGDFCREKLLKWKDIYYEGADKSVYYDGIHYYWDNMPTYASPGWYPGIFKYIRILKQYFIDNEVYPNGDTTKPRVSLP